MKMESAKLCAFLAASFLLLTLLMDPTAACMCAQQTALEAYCNTPFFIRAQFLDATEIEERFERIYDIQVTKVVKGPRELKKYKRLYTASQSNLCGYIHPVPFTTDEYLIAVKKHPNGLSTSLCGFNVRWDHLSKADKLGFRKHFDSECRSLGYP
ncbi:metalloproteinase inhibitor 1-like [Paroedura picta]|uniref:metalloproteinase inhibitor 1-like n=1 Tax=Paroedura picta TaxID=143630 RepID=UPI004057C8D1